MSKKSILFSILSLLLFAIILFGIVNFFKFSILLGFASIVLLIFPGMLQRKALDEANGGFDKILAKFIIPALAVAIGLIFILSIALWIK